MININLITDKAIQLMAGEVDFDTYHFAFSTWWNIELEEFHEDFIEVLDLWNGGYEHFTVEELLLLDDITLAAYEAAAHILHNIDITEIVDSDTLHEMIWRVVG